jgi:exopolyphosphatase/guanosine-5'-triphosphate,3'-diphosphate pyrophosphatase
MIRKIAIIDLGTNTCNLLVAEYASPDFRVLYQGKEVVKLAKSGVDKNCLMPDALARARNAIQKHLEIIKRYQVDELQVIATSAIREAANRTWFVSELEQLTGINLQIISGNREAELIFKGVLLAMDAVDDHSLILDIGGGSNEFILTKNRQAYWKQSFPIGMARVIDRIPPSDPITGYEIDKMVSFFNSHLSELWEVVSKLEVTDLIGCSGAFDTLADLIDHTDPGTKSRVRQEISIIEFERVYELLIGSTIEERVKMKGMESIRIEMIVPAVVFIKLVVDRLNIKKIIQTDFALREGILYECIFV